MSSDRQLLEQHQPTAKFVRDQEGPLGGQKLWKVNDGSYLLTSSIPNPTIASWIRETLLFPANSDGEITNFEEIEAVYQPDAHKEVLDLAGYKVEEEKDVHHQGGSTAAQ